ncbi:monovalent cation/H+ antiporter subunit D [Thiocystis violacea]|uniref:monovalent cation/H+ antiporter subunit D n=1 Tax=Thiocystis violacea TaxID=13725 RepID=UPI001904AA03|nr:monovalent cation/H+ antiporter subunit D [Thiocystis violacea]MBK1717383.1 monovalent cation/H+ antiporter subunit D [Thiocystis violacea]
MTHLVIAPVLLPLLAGILLLLTRPLLPLGVRRGLNLAAVAGQVALAVWLLTLVDGGAILTYNLGHWPAPFGIVLVADRLSVWMLLITALLAFFALLHAVRGTDRGSRHFHTLFQLQLFGLNGAFLTGDLFNLFVFFEVLLLASYGLMVHGGGARRVQAGLHFVVLNLVGSTLFLFAAGTLYGVLGTLNLADLAVKVAALPPENLGPVRAAGLLLLAVFALKAALVPLHLWLPAAYSSTSAPVAALFAIMTKVGAYCLLRVETLIFGAGAGELAGLYADWLWPLGLLTLLLGSLGALAATELRRQVAYLVVVSVGLLLSAFGLATPAGIAAGLYYLVHTTFAAAAFFLLADLIAEERGSLADRLVPGPTVRRVGLLGGLFFFTALLVAGLPPLPGFVGKFLVLRAALETPGWPWVMAVILTSGLLGIIALGRSGSLLFFATQGATNQGDSIPSDSPGKSGGSAWPTLGLLALGLILLAWSGPALEYCAAMADQLLDPQGYIQAVLEPPGAGDER